MELKRIPVGMYQANCYILMDKKSKEGIIVDPGDEANLILQTVNKMDCKVKYILLTHGHVDHVSAVKEVKDSLKAPVGINEKDEESILKGMDLFGNSQTCGVADIKIKEGDTFKIGDKEIKCIETSGHSLGGMCFLIEDIIFTGDTLFEGSIGRTDFYGGNFEILIKNIKEKILTIPEDTLVLPGHGMETTVGKEKISNPFL
ncbi:MBL fold metallo-hydrolase [Clostridium tetani]|uniref:MBL fold metallo-hydrolase n=1 Tax=Clostridium tetani TaxID=1513 RepID=A0ABY0EPG8_CLOTA|nr:MBL fold metallo-hydrolase [Clostridium tetani]CDI50367.1 hydroxyacylglutathione hydrolase [Clostridium tetani 12124569]KHO36259.1 beta-lactamase [Clostridium tetani]RXI39188.1 MBL fold metallo-hydrolase [Clostridium tetani]RXI55976.1 MBL fold metallo-hydrolase [Clostridium tetani]RXI66101.1 MBL fold metallo-hydrolase [Clostridium tetani]